MSNNNWKYKRPKVDNTGVGAITKDAKFSLLTRFLRPWIEHMREHGDRSYPPKLLALCKEAESSHVTLYKNFGDLDGLLTVSRRAMKDSIEAASASVLYAMRHLGMVVGWETFFNKMVNSPDQLALLEFNLRWESPELWIEVLSPFWPILSSVWSDDQKHVQIYKMEILTGRFVRWAEEWMMDGFPPDRISHYAAIIEAETASLSKLALPVELYGEPVLEEKV